MPKFARAIAAAALTLGLTATLAPAHAAPQVDTATSVATASVQAAAAAPRTKLTAKAPKSKVKVGKTIEVKGKLTYQTKTGYKPYAGKEVLLFVGYSMDGAVLATAKTSKSGKFTLKVKAEKWMVGSTETRVLYTGNRQGDGSASPVYVTLRVKK